MISCTVAMANRALGGAEHCSELLQRWATGDDDAALLICALPAPEEHR